MSLLAPVLPIFPTACPAGRGGGGEQLGGSLAASQGQRTTHTLTIAVSSVRTEPEEQLCVFGGNQDKVKSHPFPPCSLPRGAAECAVYGLFLSMQLRGHGLGQHSLTKFSNQPWHAAGRGQEILLHITLGHNSGISIPLPRGKLCELTPFWQIREFNGMDIACFIPVGLSVGDQPWAC